MQSSIPWSILNKLDWTGTTLGCSIWYLKGGGHGSFLGKKNHIYLMSKKKITWPQLPCLPKNQMVHSLLHWFCYINSGLHDAIKFGLLIIASWLALDYLQNASTLYLFAIHFWTAFVPVENKLRTPDNGLGKTYSQDSIQYKPQLATDWCALWLGSEFHFYNICRHLHVVKSGFSQTCLQEYFVRIDFQILFFEILTLWFLSFSCIQ